MLRNPPPLPQHHSTVQYISPYKLNFKHSKKTETHLAKIIPQGDKEHLIGMHSLTIHSRKEDRRYTRLVCTISLNFHLGLST